MRACAFVCATVALTLAAAPLAYAQARLPNVQNGAPGAAGQPNAQRFIARFQAANTTHDGHLTLAQAQAGHMPRIAKNFTAIDQQHLGYVTLQDIRAWRQSTHPGGGQPGTHPNVDPSSVIVPDPGAAAAHPYPNIAPLR